MEPRRSSATSAYISCRVGMTLRRDRQSLLVALKFATREAPRRDGSPGSLAFERRGPCGVVDPLSRRKKRLLGRGLRYCSDTRNVRVSPRTVRLRAVSICRVRRGAPRAADAAMPAARSHNMESVAEARKSGWIRDGSRLQTRR